MTTSEEVTHLFIVKQLTKDASMARQAFKKTLLCLAISMCLNAVMLVLFMLLFLT
jgi:hypothetical protein